jgi:hypothetical protein
LRKFANGGLTDNYDGVIIRPSDDNDVVTPDAKEKPPRSCPGLGGAAPPVTQQTGRSKYIIAPLDAKCKEDLHHEKRTV